MHRIVIRALIAAQLAAAPALAADLVGDKTTVDQQAGAFVGARLRLSLGGTPGRDRMRAGFVMAPTQRTLSSNGRAIIRFGDGLELGLTRDRPASLSLAGRRLSDAPGGELPERRAGVSTLAWIAIGVGTAVVLVFAAAGICQETNCLNSD